MTPLRRSRLFWSGIVVLACLLGLWADSRQQVRVLCLHRGVFVESYIFHHGEGSIELAYQYPLAGTTSPSPWAFAADATPVVGTLPWFPAPRWYSKEYPTVNYYELRIPYWLITVLALLAWSALMWRRQHWQHRLALQAVIPEANA
jgi:hypothetical protein